MLVRREAALLLRKQNTQPLLELQRQVPPQPQVNQSPRPTRIRLRQLPPTPRPISPRRRRRISEINPPHKQPMKKNHCWLRGIRTRFDISGQDAEDQLLDSCTWEFHQQVINSGFKNKDSPRDCVLMVVPVICSKDVMSNGEW
jgi:hypothetical protein